MHEVMTSVELSAEIVDRWRKLRDETEWLTIWLDGLAKDGTCLARAAYNGYISHGESGHEEEKEADDLVMLARLLGHVEERLDGAASIAREVGQVLASASVPHHVAAAADRARVAAACVEIVACLREQDDLVQAGTFDASVEHGVGEALDLLAMLADVIEHGEAATLDAVEERARELLA